MTSVGELRAVLAQVRDPELPVSITDLGILRDVRLDHGRVVVTITPTYSGCPAMLEIEADVRAALAGHDVEVRTVLSPPWTTDEITDQGRAELQAHGIAPPGRRPSPPGTAGPVPVRLGPPPPACPQCRSGDTEELSRFGSTSCTALWRCRSCREPFTHVRAH